MPRVLVPRFDTVLHSFGDFVEVHVFNSTVHAAPIVSLPSSSSTNHISHLNGRKSGKREFICHHLSTTQVKQSREHKHGHMLCPDKGFSASAKFFLSSADAEQVKSPCMGKTNLAITQWTNPTELVPTQGGETLCASWDSGSHSPARS